MLSTVERTSGKRIPSHLRLRPFHPVPASSKAHKRLAVPHASTTPCAVHTDHRFTSYARECIAEKPSRRLKTVEQHIAGEASPQRYSDGVPLSSAELKANGARPAYGKRVPMSAATVSASIAASDSRPILLIYINSPTVGPR